MQSPEAAIGLIKRRDKAVFEVQSALRMLGKYDPGNETSFVHLSNEDFRRLEDGLKRISNLLDYVSAYIQPYDSKLASYLLAYKTVIILNEAGSAELGKIRAILHRVGKDLGKVKTYTSSNDVETFTKSYQHRPKTVRPFPSKTPLFDPIANPWITQGKATGLEVHGLDMQPDVWDVDSTISTTPRTARSAQFACSANTDEHCLERVPIIHDARQSKLPEVPSPLFSNRSDKKRRGRADVDLGNAGNDLNPSSVDFSQPFASRAEAQDPFPIASHVGPSVTDGNGGWNGNLVTPARQEMLKRQNLARAERGGDSKPVVDSSVTVLPANTDEASHMQPSNVDIIEFAVVDADQTPVTGFTWITSSPPGRLRTRDAESITIMRNHVAAKLRADPRAICLWFPSEAVESNTSGSADAPTLSKHRVNVLLDPYIRLIVGNEMHTVDYSKRMTSKSIPINRASVNVGDLRKRIRAQLSIPEGQRLKLSFRGVTLNNDKVKLRDACSLGRLILQGWAPLYIQVEVEKRRECVVCKDDLSLSSFSHKPITTACSHECNTCRKCVREWIKSSLDSNGLEKLTCTECPSVLQHADVKTHASPRQFERYDNFLTRSVVNADPDFHWCISPTCNSGHSHIPTTSGPIFTCPACTLRQCIHHKVPWHTGETCHEYDYRVSSSTRWKEEEQASRKTISDTTKRCPKCEACIEKNEGCDHMTCSRCGHEFCWGCLVHYERVRRWGNSLHDEKCLHYRGVDVDAMRPPLPPAPPMPRR